MFRSAIVGLILTAVIAAAGYYVYFAKRAGNGRRNVGA
jgi:hypothetical protein